MRTLIVLGDYTSGGGSVITGSPDTTIDGKPVARVGDQATCPKHKGVFPIVSGDDSLTFDGRAVARHGDKLACGCTLIAGKQQMAFIDSGRASGQSSGRATATPPAAVPLAHAATEEICEECLLAASHRGTAFLGR